MKKELTQARLKELLHYDPETGVFTWRVHKSSRATAGSIAGRPQNRGYWRIDVDCKSYLAHRLAWLYCTGSFPRNQIDHVNRDRTDNSFKNLRDTTQTVNNLNRVGFVVNETGVPGVRRRKDCNRFSAEIKIFGKLLYLGTFKTLTEAVNARKNAEQLHHARAEAFV